MRVQAKLPLGGGWGPSGPAQTAPEVPLWPRRLPRWLSFERRRRVPLKRHCEGGEWPTRGHPGARLCVPCPRGASRRRGAAPAQPIAVSARVPGGRSPGSPGWRKVHAPPAGRREQRRGSELPFSAAWHPSWSSWVWMLMKCTRRSWL